VTAVSCVLTSAVQRLLFVVCNQLACSLLT
jgi:hypothetical protein